MSGVPSRTIRYYEGIGLLHPTLRNRHGYRLYTSDINDRLLFIKTARRVGFSLKEIQKVLEIAEEEGTPCREVLQMIKQKRKELDQQIAHLMALKSRLDQLLDQWKTGIPDRSKGEVCLLIENLNERGCQTWEPNINKLKSSPPRAHSAKKRSNW